MGIQTCRSVCHVLFIDACWCQRSTCGMPYYPWSSMGHIRHPRPMFYKSPLDAPTAGYRGSPGAGGGERVPLVAGQAET